MGVEEVKPRQYKGFVHQLFRMYTRSARLRGYTFNLSKKFFYDCVTSNCYYCGEPPRHDNYKVDRKKYKLSVAVNGIDRLNNNLGYSVKNCVPCCYVCNYFKSDMHIKHFKNRILKLAKRANLW